MLLRYGEGNRSAIVAIEKTVLLAAPRRWGGGRWQVTPCKTKYGSTKLFRRQEQRRGALGKAGQAGFRIASLDNFSRLGGCGAVLNCLSHGPGVILAPECKSPERVQ